jgi:hypothetical protein
MYRGTLEKELSKLSTINVGIPRKKLPTLSPGRSTADAITTVVMFVHRAGKLGTKCCLLALDIAGAFDNAWYPGILARLWELKCPPNIYGIIKTETLTSNKAKQQALNVSPEDSRRGWSRAQHYRT